MSTTVSLYSIATCLKHLVKEVVREKEGKDGLNGFTLPAVKEEDENKETVEVSFF